MGRNQKPLAQLAPGTFRPRSRHADRVTVPPAKLGVKIEPTHKLSREVAAEWKRLLAILDKRMTDADVTGVIELAERSVEIRRLRTAIRKATPGSLPYTRINSALTTCAAALDRLSREFGLSPLSRSSLPTIAAQAGARTWN